VTVIPRPPGVWWARTGPTPGDRLCEDAGHAVYVRKQRRQKRGARGEWIHVDVYACAVCWPDGRER
jgi:hypothetical protein